MYVKVSRTPKDRLRAFFCRLGRSRIQSLGRFGIQSLGRFRIQSLGRFRIQSLGKFRIQSLGLQGLVCFPGSVLTGSGTSGFRIERVLGLPRPSKVAVSKFLSVGPSLKHRLYKASLCISGSRCALVTACPRNQVS